ncbi:MAG: hypothetical protein E4H43_01055 [Bacteroidia bacterium]|nr:MAG: hypothetical protein E4H43_01055 [Bacteroidia bacterium]
MKKGITRKWNDNHVFQTLLLRMIEMGPQPGDKTLQRMEAMSGGEEPYSIGIYLFHPGVQGGTILCC